MDAPLEPVRGNAPISTNTGGTVTPVDRLAAVKAALPSTISAPTQERYELRDPFAEVTYRTTSLADATARAERLGSHRFVAISADGKRTTLTKVDGQWQRGPQRPPLRRPDLTDERDDESPKPLHIAVATAREDPRTDPVSDAKVEHEAQAARIEATLLERYLIKRAPVAVGQLTIGRTEYRFRGDATRVAFTESTFRLATETNSPSVARSMVDVAQARHWRGLRISGHEDFRRMVWLEASAREMRTTGYEPTAVDLELLKREREARQINRIERATPTDDPSSPKGRGGGRKAVLAAIEAVLVAKHVPEPRRTAVLEAASKQLAQRERQGHVHRVKVYDSSAPSQRQAPTPTPEPQRSRERAAPVR
ncbi:MAG: hypothetical protein HS128_03125 [Ideonella sp.]|nr:hypothetical protein [Ideonella sp.]